jgi:hypothetical protein
MNTRESRVNTILAVRVCCVFNNYLVLSESLYDRLRAIDKNLLSKAKWSRPSPMISYSDVSAMNLKMGRLYLWCGSKVEGVAIEFMSEHESEPGRETTGCNCILFLGTIRRRLPNNLTITYTKTMLSLGSSFDHHHLSL